MIHIFLSMFLSIVFGILGGFHLYWFFGGKWGLEKVIPSKDKETESLSIPRLATLFVAIVLMFFGFIYVIKTGVIAIQIPYFIRKIVYWVIPLLFLVRAIGDFNYVGIFKKIKHTEFAKADSRVFIPICITIGIIGVLIAW